MRGMLSGFTMVISIAGAVAAAALVLFLIGAANQHAKGMVAVGDGLVDCLKWLGYLLGRGFGALGL